MFGGASSSTGTAQAAASQSAPAAEDDDEIDLFGSDDVRLSSISSHEFALIMRTDDDQRA